MYPPPTIPLHNYLTRVLPPTIPLHNYLTRVLHTTLPLHNYLSNVLPPTHSPLHNHLSHIHYPSPFTTTTQSKFPAPFKHPTLTNHFQLTLPSCSPPHKPRTTPQVCSHHIPPPHYPILPGNPSPPPHPDTRQIIIFPSSWVHSGAHGDKN